MQISKYINIQRFEYTYSLFHLLWLLRKLEATFEATHRSSGVYIDTCEFENASLDMFKKIQKKNVHINIPIHAHLLICVYICIYKYISRYVANKIQKKKSEHIFPYWHTPFVGRLPAQSGAVVKIQNISAPNKKNDNLNDYGADF